MDFTLTKEQQYIQKAAREFAVGEFKDVAREYDLNETFPQKILDKARELDLPAWTVKQWASSPTSRCS